MYTLQILDAGQTFLHTLGEGAASLGSAEGVDIRLRESGVEAIHARFDTDKQRVRLTAEPDCEVLVNGSVVSQSELQLGDRIEIGRSVMIIGRTVSRAAQPEDVLASGLSRAPRERRRKSGASKLLPVLAGGLVLAGVVFMATQGDDSSDIRGRLGVVESARAAGDLGKAAELSARLRREWAAATDDRLAELDALDAEIAKVATTHAELVAQVMSPDDDRTYAQWLQYLRSLEARGAPAERVAARKLRSRLKQTLMERSERDAKLARAANSGQQSSPVGSPRYGDRSGSGGAVIATPSSGAAQIAGDEIERLCGGGLYAQALSLTQEALGEAANPAEVRALQATEAAVREGAVVAMEKLIADSRGFEREGRLQHALTLLQTGRHNFPSSSDFKPLGEEVFRLQETVRIAAQLAAAQAQPAAKLGAGAGEGDQANHLATLESLRGHMAEVRAAEDRGDFARQAALLREAAAGVRSRDQDFAERLLTQAHEASLLSAWQDAVIASMAGGKELIANDRRGYELQLQRVEGKRIFVRSANGEEALDWSAVDSSSMQALGKTVEASGQVALGLASLLYRNGDEDDAEAVLVSVVRADDSMQEQVNAMIARGRGEPVDERGYVLRKGKFESLRQIELQKISRRLLGKLDVAMRSKDAKARGVFVRETLAGGGLQAEALVFALRDQLTKCQSRIDSGSLRKKVDKMIVAREELDAARAHAKELIYDEVRYFYPYKPPAVTGEKFAEYNRVQAEVSERVAALRDVWKNTKLKFRVPTQMGADLEQVDWLVTQLAQLGGLPDGESSSSILEPMEWALALEPGVPITLQNFCLTPMEREQRAGWRRVEGYNAAAKDEFSVAVQTLLRITNDYRAMFGHRPLAAVKSACEGSQGHADEMSRLGYFSHMSPVPGRRTPRDRMKLAGYMFGVSENIAKTGGALGSHNAWCRSSGHHRNLLMANHREIGIGANGRYWVQNFGSGDVYKTHPAWLAQKSR
jgi:hypothetical protein